MEETNHTFGPGKEEHTRRPDATFGLSQELQQLRPEEMVGWEPIRELSAVAFPELGKRDESNNLHPTTEDETLSTLNNFLEELNAQGAEIVSILDVNVSVSNTHGAVTGEGTETRKFVVIRKPKQG